MASSITHLPNKTSMNHISFPQNFHPKTHPFGQVSLPNNNHLSPSLKSSIVASNSALLEIILPTTTNNIYTNTISTSITPKHTQKITHKISTTSTSSSSSSTTTTKHLANIWREIQGCNNWENLLNPLHPILREEIIRYGEFVTSSYKAFDLDTNSKRYLNCKYGKKNMLKQVGMENCGYEVTKYIYATPPNIIENNSSGRWIGYVAVSSDDSYKKLGRRDIVVTFRGTVTNQEWISNLMSSLTPASLDPNNQLPNVKVESGFLSLYTSDESSSKFGLQSCREQLLSEVSRLMKKHKGEKNVSISLAGHSMGSALAILLAYDISELGLNKKNDKNDASVTVFSFGGPRVGNLEFKKRCEELGVKVLRISNVNDPITKLPGVVFNENFRVLMGGRYEFPWSCSCYAHVGVELMLDFFNMQNPSRVHDLDTYIGLLRCPKKKIEEVIHSQSDGGGVNFLLEKARMFLLKSSISQVFAAGGGNHHDFLSSVSTDIMCSWSDELLFGLVLLLL